MNNSANLPAAIILGLSPTGLHVARTLHRLGVRTVGIGRPHEVGMVSRLLTYCVTDEGRGDCLERARSIVGPEPAVLFPTSDEYVDLVSKASDPQWIFQESYRSGLSELLLTKSQFYNRCAELGMKHPKSVHLGNPKSRDRLSDLSLPVILKPSRMHDHKAIMRGTKGWIVGDAGDLDRVWPLIVDFPGDIVAQEFIPGAESEIRLVCGTIRAGGEQSSLFTARKLRQYPRGMGTASLVQSAPETEAAEMAVTFLKKTGYQGIFGAEMKRHAITGELYFIEINPRTSLWFSVSEAAGCPVVQQSYLDVIGSDRPIWREAQQNGIRWRYWLKDTATCAGYMLRPKALFPTPNTSDVGPVAGRVWAVFERGDIRPALHEPFLLARKAVVRMIQKFRAR